MDTIGRSLLRCRPPRLHLPLDSSCLQTCSRDRPRTILPETDRKLLALPFLPSDGIRVAFNQLVIGDLSTPLRKLMDYIRSTWMGGRIWSPEAWLIYKCAIRTNNDTEGWHNRINSWAGGYALPFCRLIDMLHTKASLVDLQVRLLNKRKL